MGAWGVKLYDNDVAEDIKNTYKEKLQEGKSNEEATDEIISDYEYMLEDVDDAPLFWMALADQQWRLGRLLPNVKEQALKWIEKGADLQVWYDESEKLGNQRKKVLEELSFKLNSPQPPEKKIYKRRYYRCPWKNGDVFALPLNDCGQEYGLNNKYIMFQQISQIKFCKNTVPLVRCWISDNSEYTLDRKGCTKCIRWRKKMPGGYNLYIYELNITSKRIIPNDLIYVGNYQIFVPEDDGGYDTDHCSLLQFNNIKETVIRKYIKLNC